MAMDAAPHQPILTCRKYTMYHTRSTTHFSNIRATDCDSEDDIFIPVNSNGLLERPTQPLRNRPVPTFDIHNVTDSGEAMNSANDRDHELLQ